MPGGVGVEGAEAPGVEHAGVVLTQVQLYTAKPCAIPASPDFEKILLLCMQSEHCLTVLSCLYRFLLLLLWSAPGMYLTASWHISLSRGHHAWLVCIFDCDVGPLIALL